MEWRSEAWAEGEEGKEGKECLSVPGGGSGETGVKDQLTALSRPVSFRADKVKAFDQQQWITLTFLLLRRVG